MTRRFCAYTMFLCMLLVATATLASQLTGLQLTKLAEEGESLFRQKCASCHSIGEGDRTTGPDLASVAEHRDRQWLVDFITNPGTLIKSGDPIANELLAKFNNLQMPSLNLSSEQINALLTYLAHPEEAAHHAVESEISQPAGDPARGEALFVGKMVFNGGGAPCLACHGIAATGLGNATGASYGPDLSTTFSDYGEEELLNLLADIPFPSMEAIYTNHPLDEKERADLTAFMGSISGEMAPIDTALMLHGGGLALVFFVVIGALGWRRLKCTRAPLIERARLGKGGAA